MCNGVNGERGTQRGHLWPWMASEEPRTSSGPLEERGEATPQNKWHSKGAEKMSKGCWGFRELGKATHGGQLAVSRPGDAKASTGIAQT